MIVEGGKVVHFNFRKTVWLVTLPGDLVFLVLARYADDALMFVVARYPIDEDAPPKVDPASHEELAYLKASGVPVHEAD